MTTMTTGGATVTLVPPGTYDNRTTKGGLYFTEFKLRKEYGTAVVQPGGTVTVPSGIFTTNASIMLINPGGNLAAITTNLDRTGVERSVGSGAAGVLPLGLGRKAKFHAGLRDLVV